MELINEEDDMAIFFDIIDDVVHPLFKISTEPRPCDNIHQVQL